MNLKDRLWGKSYLYWLCLVFSMIGGAMVGFAVTPSLPYDVIGLLGLALVGICVGYAQIEALKDNGWVKVK